MDTTTSATSPGTFSLQHHLQRSNIANFATLIDDDNIDDTVVEKQLSDPRQGQQQPFILPLLLICASTAAWCISPQLVDAAVFPNQQHQQQQQQSIILEQSRTGCASSSSSLYLATYASEGAGGMPFLSPFQTPGAVPLPTDSKYDDREARNRAFDEAFDQDKRDRDSYYAKMAIQSREKKMAELKARRAELGLDTVDAGPRYGDEKVEGLQSLKTMLSAKDPSTMTDAELKEYQQLMQQRP